MIPAAVLSRIDGRIVKTLFLCNRQQANRDIIQTGAETFRSVCPYRVAKRQRRKVTAPVWGQMLFNNYCSTVTVKFPNAGPVDLLR